MILGAWKQPLYLLPYLCVIGIWCWTAGVYIFSDNGNVSSLCWCLIFTYFFVFWKMYRYNILSLFTKSKWLQLRSVSHIFLQDIHDGLDFSQHQDVQYSFGIFSVKFSSDGRELVAGSNDESIYVYDLHANKLTLRLPAHTVWQIAYFLGLYKPSIFYLIQIMFSTWALF